MLHQVCCCVQWFVNQCEALRSVVFPGEDKIPILSAVRFMKLLSGRQPDMFFELGEKMLTLLSVSSTPASTGLTSLCSVCPLSDVEFLLLSMCISLSMVWCSGRPNGSWNFWTVSTVCAHNCLTTRLMVTHHFFTFSFTHFAA